jgi:hypothetical protein
MKSAPIKIAVTGTHSTGKSTFIVSLAECLEKQSKSVGLIGDLAKRARDMGFPILTGHTYESTLWMMAEGLRQETELSLNKQIILIDRPIFDALGYLEAALEITGRTLIPGQLEELRAIAAAHSASYDFVIATALDPSVPLGEGRDPNAQFREAAAKHIDQLVKQHASSAMRMTISNREDVLAKTLSFISSRD